MALKRLATTLLVLVPLATPVMADEYWARPMPKPDQVQMLMLGFATSCDPRFHECQAWKRAVGVAEHTPDYLAAQKVIIGVQNQCYAFSGAPVVPEICRKARTVDGQMMLHWQLLDGQYGLSQRTVP